MRSDPIQVVRKLAKRFSFEKPPELLIVSIDPGATGAIAIQADERYAVLDIPNMKIKRGRGNQTVYDRDLIVKVFKLIEGMNAKRMRAAVEVPPPKGYAYAMFRLGVNYGLWPMFLMRCGFRVAEYSPQHWKVRMKLSKDKKRSLAIARKKFPKAELHLARHHDRAEALLLGLYHKNVLGGML